VSQSVVTEQTATLLLDRLEAAWGDGRLDLSIDQYGAVVTALFPEQFLDPKLLALVPRPRKKCLWRVIFPGGLTADVVAMTRFEARSAARRVLGLRVRASKLNGTTIERIAGPPRLGR
jgi:hypothetical protein